MAAHFEAQHPGIAVWKQARRFTSLDNVIDVQMMRLRRKIDPEGVEPLIHTVRGIGYRLGRELA